MDNNTKRQVFQMNIRFKILMGVSVVLLILLILGGTAIFNLSDIRQSST